MSYLIHQQMDFYKEVIRIAKERITTFLPIDLEYEEEEGVDSNSK